MIETLAIVIGYVLMIVFGIWLGYKIRKASEKNEPHLRYVYGNDDESAYYLVPIKDNEYIYIPRYFFYDIEQMVDYLYEAEEKHFEECERQEQKDHIFNYVQRMQNALEIIKSHHDYDKNQFL